MMKAQIIVRRQARSWSALAAAATLAACGGGGGDTSAPPPSAPVPTSATISGKAMDGALQGATACYDSNENGSCDAVEPTSAATDANGSFSLAVPLADVGKHRVIVNVPANAIDKDTGAAVGTAFVLVSPATGTTTAHALVATPLTTLVQAQIDATGASLAVASDFIKTQAGLAVSPLADYSATAGADNTRAGNVARLVVLSTQQQNTALAGVVNQLDVSGSAVTQAQLDKTVIAAIISTLPAIGGAVDDPAVAAAATPGALTAALTAAAQSIVQTQTGLTPAAALVAVGVAKLPPDVAAVAAPTAGANMRGFSYTDSNNWFVRSLQSSAADNTPDANGRTRFYDVRSRMAPSNFSPDGVMQSWGSGGSLERAGDLHWNGSAWVGCPLGMRSSSSARDALGRWTYDYCDKLEEGTSQRTGLDLSGQTLLAVVRDKIRTLAGGDSGIAYANWGPSDLIRYGNATFPAGSKLWYYTNQTLASAPAYDVQASNVLGLFSAEVVVGGDARNGSVACANVGTTMPAVNLEQLVARFPGKPCLFNPQTNADGTSLTPSESWGVTSASLGDVANAITLPAGTGNYYTTTARLRVAFDASGSGTTYLQCLVRRADNSTRNCTPIGSGSYAIQTLGDARTLTFTNLPAITQRTGFTRVFVERGGKVYYGYKNPVGATTQTPRLNLAAGNAVLRQLGLPRMQPADLPGTAIGAKAATQATLKGVWGSSDGSDAFFLRFGDNGQFLLAQASTSPSVNGELPGAELGWLDLDLAAGTRGVLMVTDTNGQAGLSHPGVGEGITAVSATAINYVGGSIPRLANVTSGIVGLWAIGSASDLSVPHFMFYPNGKLVMVQITGETDTAGACFQARQGPPGIEYADYTFEPATGMLHIFNKIRDTNGCVGIFDSSARAVPNGTANLDRTFTLIFSADAKSATVAGSTETIYRIPAQ